MMLCAFVWAGYFVFDGQVPKHPGHTLQDLAYRSRISGLSSRSHPQSLWSAVANGVLLRRESYHCQRSLPLWPGSLGELYVSDPARVWRTLGPNSRQSFHCTSATSNDPRTVSAVRKDETLFYHLPRLTITHQPPITQILPTTH